MKYLSMSDRELEIAVAKTLHLHVEKRCMYNIGTIDVVVIKSGNHPEIIERVPKYCSSIEGWDIVKRNSIDIEWPEPSLGGIGSVHKYLEGDTDLQIEFTDKNDVLRCAMIVYLMWVDKQNEN